MRFVRYAKDCIAERAKGKRYVLIVEDDPHLSKALATWVGLWNKNGNLFPNKKIEAIQAKDFEKVFQNLPKYHDHLRLIIMDIMLPGNKNGIEIAREIRKKNDLKFVPILFVSAKYPEGSQQPLREEFDPADFITKPLPGYKPFLERVKQLLIQAKKAKNQAVAKK